jgi:hypothetical protein
VPSGQVLPLSSSLRKLYFYFLPAIQVEGFEHHFTVTECAIMDLEWNEGLYLAMGGV